MKYDILEPFKEYLQENMPANTARKYYASVVRLFREAQFQELEQFTPEWILSEAKKNFTTRNEFSAVKNGLKWLAKYDSSLKLPSEEQFKEISVNKRNRSKKPKKVIYLKPTQRTINQISNDKLRFAYRLAMVSGLRVSELADLESADIMIQDNKILVRVRNGKGGHGGVVECMQDEYLIKNLPQYLEANQSGKLFYSESYMRRYANELGFECHDLRRIFAITNRNKLKESMPLEQANEIVRQRLRHVRFSTTKRYLFNRKLQFEYEKTNKGENMLLNSPISSTMMTEVKNNI